MKLIFLDVETAGLDIKKHGIIQISGIIEINKEIKEEFDFKCNIFQHQEIEEEALKVNGITKEQIKSYPTPQEVYKQLLTIFNKYIDRYNKKDKFYMVGQNTKFDYDRMFEWFVNNGNKYFYAYINYHLIDLVTITAMLKIANKINVENMKLETVCKNLAIELKSHNSLEDIRATRKVFYKYLDMIK